MWLTFGLIASVFALLYGYLVWNFNYWKNRGVPGPKPIPLAGSFISALTQKRNLIYDIDDAYKKYRGTASYFGYFNGRLPALMVMEPKLIKEMLVSNFKSFHDNELASMIDKESDPVFGRNPFVLTGDEWKEKRSEITPAFTSSKLKSIYPIVEDVCRKMTVYLDDKKLGNAIDAKELGAKFTVDTVSSCIYGIDSKAFSEERSIIREMSANIAILPWKTIIYIVIAQIFPIIVKFVKIRFISKQLTEFFTGLMDQAISIRKNSGIERDDYLNYLLQLQKKKNLQSVDMAAHTLTFFLDGFETSSSVISHILYNLAAHPDYQQKLRSEITELLNKDGKITYENLLEMQYLDCIFNESLRITPVVGMLPRRCTESTELIDNKDKKVTIDKGLVAMVPIYSIHHDAEYYANPEKFDPDRFSAENGGLKRYKDQGVFLAWGEGPRICLGIRFGSLQVKAAIVEIIRNFNISVNKKTQLPFVYDPQNILLMPIGGIWLNFKKV